MSKQRELEEANKELKRKVNALQSLMEKKKEEEEERKNREFVQLYKKELRAIRKLTQDDKNALTVLLILVEKMNKRNAIIISHANLMKITGKGRTAIHKAVSALKKHKYVEILKSGAANIYIVNSNVFWQTDNKTKEKFSTFDATVYATLDEQDKSYQENWKDVKLKSVPVIQDASAIEEQLEMLEEEH